MKAAGKIFGLLILVICLEAKVSRANVEGFVSEPLGAGIAVVDQVVELPFVPQEVFLLISTRKVRRFRGAVVSYTPIKQVPEGHQSFLAGGSFPFSASFTSPKGVYSSFVFIGPNKEIATSSAKYWSLNDLKQNSQTILSYSKNSKKLEHRIDTKVLELSALDRELQELRERASKLIDVDALVAAKMELEILRHQLEEKRNVVNRLLSVVEIARELPETPELYSLQRELQTQLKDAAKVSALADRLNTRRRQAAVASFKSKVALVRKMREYEPEALAKRVLELRNRRAKLERQLGIAPASDPIEGDF